MSTQPRPSAASLRRETACAAGAVAALALLVTHPLIWNAADALPGDLGDPLLNTFILGWGAARLPHGFSGFWSAPFFFPLPDALALSEHLLGITVFTAPVIWATGNPVLAYNLALFGSYALAGAGMYLLARELWGRRDAAWLAALAFAFAPHRLMHLPHLQVLMAGWMPVGLWGLHRYFGTGSRRPLAVFAGAYALLALSNGYFLYFFAVPVTVIAACALARSARAGGRGRRLRVPWRQAGNLAIAAAAILAAVVPAALAYVRVRQGFGFRRSVDEMASYSAAWSDYLRIPNGLQVWSGLLRVGEGERMLFPGLTVAALAALAAASARRSAWPGAGTQPEAWRWHLGLYTAILALALWLAAGPAVPGPYALMLAVLPGFDGLRVSARFVVIAALALTVLGAAGAAWGLARLRPRAAAVTALALGAAIVAEGYGGPVNMIPFRHDQRSRAPLNDWLRQGPPGGLLELPIAGPDLAPYTLAYQYNTLRHGRPIINGYSGYGYGLQDFLGGPGSPVGEIDAIPSLIAALRGIGVRHVVLHPSTFSERHGLGFPDPSGLIQAIDHAVGGPDAGRRFYDAIAWRLPPGAARLPVDESALSPLAPASFAASASAMPDRLRFAFDGDIDTKWLSAAPQAGAEWIRLDFGAAIDVGRLTILTNRFGVGDYPRGLVIESESPDGSRLPLISGSFLPALVRGLASGASGAPAELDLPSNRSRVLWLRQTGRSEKWQWAVHELRVYRRRAG